jgi:small-conductance mechanosensitive channel
MLENFFAGIQLAITQPIRVDDAVIVENEYGWVEEFGSTYVVVRLWDRRRLILPLGYFLTKPFQNWTRGGGALIGSVFIFLDYTAPVERIRTKLRQIVKDSKLWDGDVVNLQVTDAKDDTIEIRMVMSAKKPSDLWDLRCDVRERLLAYIQSEMPSALPRHRNIKQSSSLAAE